MEIHVENGNGTCQLRLEGELTIYHATEAKPKLVEALNNHAEVDLHLADVSEIDTAGLQLLIMAKLEAMTAGKTLRLVDHSPAVLEIIELFDLAGYFGDPVLIQSQAS
jgi:anti-sigma B factor antagonist